MIHRRTFASMMLAAPFFATGCSARPEANAKPRREGFTYSPGITTSEPLVAPQGRSIRVAFAINPGFQVIDLAGPWETFQDTFVSPVATEPTFELYTVSETAKPFRGSGGLMLVPDFTIENAPPPDLLVIPNFLQPDPRTHETSAIHQWIKETHANNLLTMSICTGAFQLAKTGLLDNVPMTTNQKAYNNFARSFPSVDLRRGPRFVETGRIATAGGLSAGIDLALRVVARFFGGDVAQQTADTMEYLGHGWRVG